MVANIAEYSQKLKSVSVNNIALKSISDLKSATTIPAKKPNHNRPVILKEIIKIQIAVKAPKKDCIILTTGGLKPEIEYTKARNIGYKGGLYARSAPSAYSCFTIRCFARRLYSPMSD